MKYEPFAVRTFYVKNAEIQEVQKRTRRPAESKNLWCRLSN
jgi:hypothetical protein